VYPNRYALANFHRVVKVLRRARPGITAESRRTAEQSNFPAHASARTRLHWAYELWKLWTL